jgi:hypothetical protein
MSYLDPEWRSYCVYAGRHLPPDAMDDEHVIPLSLGGGRSTVIRASKALNNRFAREIDAKVANDPLIVFGRRDAKAKGHSRKMPVPRWRDARPRTSGPLMGSPERINIDFPPGRPVQYYDRRRGQPVPASAFSTALMAPLQLESDARLLFCLKTLLGVGWRVFGPRLQEALYADDVRARLGVDGIEPSDQFSMRFVDPGTPRSDEGHAYVAHLERNLVEPLRTTMLARETDTHLEWSVACVGYFVGLVILPLRARLLPPTVGAGAGLFLLAGRGSLRPEIRQTAP